MKKKIIYIVAGIFVLFIVFRIVSYKKGSREEVEFAGKREVPVVRVERRNIIKTIPVLGEVFGNPEVKVFPKVTGKLVKKLKFPGSRVRKDEVLCLIDRDEPAFKFTTAEVRSPISGIVLDYFLDIGAQISPQTAILKVANFDTVKILLYFSESDFIHIKKGQRVLFTSLDKTFAGFINRVYPSPDEMSKKFKAEVIFKNKKHILKPAMSVDAKVVIDERVNALAIPKYALHEVSGKTGVFVIENGVARFREVKAGFVGDEFVEVKGLKKGDEVIGEVFGLKEGLKVKRIKNDK